MWTSKLIGTDFVNFLKTWWNFFVLGKFSPRTSVASLFSTGYHVPTEPSPGKHNNHTSWWWWKIDTGKRASFTYVLRQKRRSMELLLLLFLNSSITHPLPIDKNTWETAWVDATGYGVRLYLISTPDLATEQRVNSLCSCIRLWSGMVTNCPLEYPVAMVLFFLSENLVCLY